jgi:hypothetical protein
VGILASWFSLQWLFSHYLSYVSWSNTIRNSSLGPVYVLPCAQIAMSCAACNRCGRQRQEEHVAERAGSDNELDFGFHAAIKDFPAIHGDLCPSETPPSPSIRRFPSLSKSTIGSDESSNTLAEREDHARSIEDVEENTGPAPAAAVAFFDSALSKVRLAVVSKYSRTRTWIFFFHGKADPI